MARSKFHQPDPPQPSRPAGLPCSNCRRPNDRLEQRYCSTCHAAYMRAHRAKKSAEIAALRKIAGPRKVS